MANLGSLRRILIYPLRIDRVIYPLRRYQCAILRITHVTSINSPLSEHMTTFPLRNLTEIRPLRVDVTVLM